jgi:hypothetical protein
MDKFHQQVIHSESYNAIYKNHLGASNVEVSQNNSKLSFYDLSSLIVNNNVKSKPTHLVFYTCTVQYANINFTVPTKNNEKIVTLFFIRPHEFTKYTLRQTTKLAKTIIHHSLWCLLEEAIKK